MSGVLNKLPVTIYIFKVLLSAGGGTIFNDVWITETGTIHGVEN